MCGIAGIFAYCESAPPVDRAELLRIREAMIHRGPDGAGLWVSNDARVVVLLELLGKTNRLSVNRDWLVAAP